MKYCNRKFQLLPIPMKDNSLYHNTITLFGDEHINKEYIASLIWSSFNYVYYIISVKELDSFKP